MKLKFMTVLMFLENIKFLLHMMDE